MTSAFILQEFEDKLKGKFKVPTEKASVAISLLRGSAELVTPAPLHPQICRDRDDDWVLAGATKRRHAWIAQMGKSRQHGLGLLK